MSDQMLSRLRTNLWAALLLPFLLLLCPHLLFADNPRVIVLTDIGGDPDDQQSLVRLLLYSNQLDIEGLIAVSRNANGYDTKPDLIRQTVAAYGAVRDNLLLHEDGYPTASYLMQRIRAGNPRPGPSSVGPGHDTEASEHIISVVDAADERPVWVIVWGGSTDLAQALWKVRATRPADLERFISKIRVYAIGDQDRTGSLIRKQFPRVFFIHADTTSGPNFAGLPRGMYQNRSGGQNLVRDPGLVSLDWVKKNVAGQHGPLGALYPMNALQTPAQTHGVKEGDTPSFLYLLSGNKGLSDPEHPTWGSWGGRFQGSGVFRNAADDHWSGSRDLDLRQKWTVARFRSAYQNDFQARMDWCVKSHAAANHAPVALLDADPTPRVMTLDAVSGDEVRVSADGSYDPDGDSISYSWFVYREAGTQKRTPKLRGARSPSASFIAPAVSRPRTLHLILQVSDSGRPSLTSYRRVVVTIAPRPS